MRKFATCERLETHREFLSDNITRRQDYTGVEEDRRKY